MPADLERVPPCGMPRHGREAPQPGLLGPYVLIGYALVTPPLPSPDPPSNRLQPDQVSGPRHVLTDSAPAPPEAATRPLVQMPPTALSRDLAYTRALAAASQRMWAASDVAALWRMSTKPWR